MQAQGAQGAEDAEEEVAGLRSLCRCEQHAVCVADSKEVTLSRDVGEVREVSVGTGVGEHRLQAQEQRPQGGCLLCVPGPVQREDWAEDGRWGWEVMMGELSWAALWILDGSQ